ncbi:serine/threonine-protein kinase [Actinomadura chokoriensis]|uniref:serine/threonine-protein kinase n=1 Tax=Actinomadura chokoriensis TaxID=454156 RepID=UPI0031F80162
MTFGAGTVVGGKYRLERRVKEGGQGVLWEAVDQRNGLCVAVKVFKRQPDAVVDWSRREIGVLHALPPSPYVVAVHESGKARGRVYMAMEWIDGRPLADFPRPRLEQVQRWCHQICLGLAHCHRWDVFHRDITPNNIMITSADEVKLVDFGIARSSDTTMTPTGLPIGTPPYLAPERWRGERGDDLDATPVSPKAVVGGIPDALDRLALHLLAKDPDRRPRSADEVIARLQEIIRPPLADTPVAPSSDLPHVDPGTVGRLHAADNALWLATRNYGTDDIRTLEARAEVAEQIGRSGDRVGAIRAYDELIPDFVRVCGPYSKRSQEIRRARMNWVLGIPPSR